MKATRAALKERPGDCYDTPPQAVRALLAVEKLPYRIWEPACGTGNIVTVLRRAGHAVVATDLNQRGCPDSLPRVDFLLPLAYFPPCDAIVTNPPFALAQRFIERALERTSLVIMLLRLAFLESERRSNILDGGQLRSVHVFKNRLPMMHRAGWTGPKATSAIAFAWFVWDLQHRGPATIDRISWDDYDPVADVEGSFNLGYETIRERKAAGGVGWEPK